MNGRLQDLSNASKPVSPSQIRNIKFEVQVAILKLLLLLGVTLARFYCDCNTRSAFSRLFSELFRVIQEVTGSNLKFYALYPGDTTAKLRALIMDGEAAQAQGLSDELVLYAAKIPEFDPSIPRNDLDLLMMVLKTCSIHFEQQVGY